MSDAPIGNMESLLGISSFFIRVVDVGASPTYGQTPYAPLLASGCAQVIGFDPNSDALALLNQKKGPSETYLPYVIGDGSRHTLRVCQECGMTSLFQPNDDVLALFQNFSYWGAVMRTEEVDTVRLDDVPETALLDFLKIDIQGAELMVFQNATERLRNALLIHTEVLFLPMYVGQPLFSDVDQFLRQYGFILHRFEPLISASIMPLGRRDSPLKGLGQVLYADAVFIRDIVNLNPLSAEQLLKLAVILHDCYLSYDVALRLLTEYDRRIGTRYGETYLKAVTGAQ